MPLDPDPKQVLFKVCMEKRWFGRKTQQPTFLDGPRLSKANLSSSLNLRSRSPREQPSTSGQRKRAFDCVFAQVCCGKNFMRCRGSHSSHRIPGFKSFETRVYKVQKPDRLAQHWTTLRHRMKYPRTCLTRGRQVLARSFLLFKAH